jgi:hypothetical protein
MFEQEGDKLITRQFAGHVNVVSLTG